MAGRFGLGYAWLPLVSTVVWFGTILALLIIWLANDHPRYENSEHRIVYISDVGGKYRGLFIPGSAVTGLFFIATVIADRSLRHRNRLPAFTQSREERLSFFSILFAVIGSIALLLLSILDTFHHSHAHWTFTGIFIVAIGLSVLLNALETFYMSRAYPALRRMHKSRTAKFVLVALGLSLAIAMAIMMGTCSERDGVSGLRTCNRVDSASAVFEWAIAFILSGFFATYVADLKYQDETLPEIEREMQQGGMHPKVTHPENPAATAVQDIPIGEANA